MAIPSPKPLFPKLAEFRTFSFEDFPTIEPLLDEPWKKKTWQWAFEFLNYIGRNKSEHTFGRFRNEVERFLNWVFLVKGIEIDKLRKQDILEYADFCWKPPKAWISTGAYDRFELKNGQFSINKKWRPFRYRVSKASESEADKSKYRPSQESLAAVFTGLIAFYKYLMEEEYLYGNPVQLAKKDCRHFIKDSQVKEVKRLSEEQWEYLIQTCIDLADSDPLFERHLFLIATLKSLFLRISELSERKEWQPVMGHFWEDLDKNWWLKIYGKGRKIRDVTVPTNYLEYLVRYRRYRGQVDLPLSGENSPIIEKLRGTGGLTSRHLSRLVQEVFDEAYKRMSHSEGDDKARKLKEATTHWLRHTGASMEIERGRQMKDLSEDLGHASIATTDTIYVQSEDKKRAESGKRRRV